MRLHTSNETNEIFKTTGTHTHGVNPLSIPVREFNNNLKEVAKTTLEVNFNLIHFIMLFRDLHKYSIEI